MAPQDLAPFLTTNLPSEVSVITPIGAAPDPESYTQVTEELADVTVFNPTVNDAEPKQTRRIVISGVKVVISASKTPALYKQLNNQSDLAAVTILAFEVEIHSPLHMPGTHVHINAESLKIIGDGQIKTSPPDYDVPANSDTASLGNPAGDIYLQVRMLEAPGPQPRLIVTGGKGQDALQGERGADGRSVPEWNGKITTRTAIFTSEELSWAEDIKNFDHRAVRAFCYGYADMRDKWFDPALWMQIGDPFTFGTESPTDGNKPVRMPGTPGSGGRGGTIITSQAALVKGVSTLGLGASGKKADDLEEAKAGEPTQYSHVDCAFAKYLVPHFKAGVNGNGILNMKWDTDGKWHVNFTGKTKPYPAVKAPDAPAETTDRSGGLRDSPFLDKFRPPPILALQAIIAYARDGFRAGAAASVREIVRYNLGLLEVAQGNWDKIAKSDHPDAPELVFPLEYQAALSELTSLLVRIDSAFDYFGNPVGWVPALSLLGNLAAFEKETNDAISRLYLAYWMEHNQASREARVSAIEQAVEKLDGEIVSAGETYSAALKAIAKLAVKEKALSNNVALTVAKIAALENDLRTKVAGDLQLEHMLRTAGKVLGGIAQLIPVGQPALGAVGVGLSSLADWDSDKPFDSIANIGSALWSTKLVEDKLMPWAKDKAKSFLDISSSDDDDKPKSDYDKEMAKTKLSNKVKKDIAEEAATKKEITGALSGLMVSQDEIDTALAKALADCPEYNEMAEEVVAMNKQHEEFATMLLAAANAIQQATHTIVTARMTQIELRGSVAKISQGLSPEALAFTRDMRLRALERLHRYQYYFAASYRYLWFETPPGYDPYSTKMMKELARILAPEDGTRMSGDDYDRLGIVFQEGLKTVADHMLTYFNTVRPKSDSSGKVTSRVLIELNEHQLAELNGPAKSVEIDPLRMGKIHLGMQDVRIFGLSVEHAELIEPPEKSTEVRVRVKHSDESVLRHEKQRYQFRNTSRLWQATVRHSRGKTSILPEGDDPMDLSLLRHLLGNIDKSVPLFHRPSAAGPLRVERELMDMKSGYSGQFKSLTLEIQYTSQDVSSDIASLLVVPTANTGAVIQCTKPDLNGRANGRDMFLRVFDKGAAVQLSAPETFGTWQFLGWRTRGHDGTQDPSELVPLVTPETADGIGDITSLDKSPELSLTLDEPQLVEAVFAQPV